MASDEKAAETLHYGVPLVRAIGLIMLSNTPKGRGVFANQDISSGTVLETCPVLVLDQTENETHIRKTMLHHYFLDEIDLTIRSNWPIQNSDGRADTAQAVILGLGSLFNHSTHRQNVGWTRDLGNKLVTYTALRDIRKGEELCISYGDRLTFVDVDAPTSSNVEDDGDNHLLGIAL